MELLLRVPTLPWGVQWSACLVWPPLRNVGSLAPAPLLYEGLLPGASLHMPTLSWGVQWSTCLSGLRRASSVLPFLPLCFIEGFFLELLVRMPTLFWGIQWSTYQFGPPSCDFSSCGSCLLLYRGVLPRASCLRMPALSWGVQWSAYLSGLHCATSFLPTLFLGVFLVIIGLIPFLSVPQFVGAFFRMCFFKSCYLVILGSTFLQKAM